MAMERGKLKKENLILRLLREGQGILKIYIKIPHVEHIEHKKHATHRV